MEKTFLFYDVETSGLSAYFDQILTFAAIRTDMELKEIERYSIKIRMRSDIVPSPGAFITHRLTPEELESGICEYDAALQIHEIMNTSGTVSLGYNTLGFDDEFLRFAFYRNLLEPYTHQYANGCSRMDILPITTLYRIFKPDIMKWPEINGKPTLKLELISNLNQLVQSGRAHDAMTDVEATLALARILKSEEEMWNYCIGFFDKKEDRNRMEKLPLSFRVAGEHYRVGLMVSLKFGKDLMYMAPVVGIGDSISYGNQSLWLRLDKDILPDSPPLKLDEHFPIRKKYGEQGLLLPPYDRFWDSLPPAQKQMQQASISKNMERVNRSRADVDMFQQIVDYHRNYKYPFVPDIDIDASLYQDPFFSLSEKKEAARFHKAPLGEKVKMAEETLSPRVRTLACRILFRNFSPSMLSASILSERNSYMAKVIHGDKKDHPGILGFKNDFRLTPSKALEEISALNGSIPVNGDLNEESSARCGSYKKDNDNNVKADNENGDNKVLKQKKRVLDNEQINILSLMEKYLSGFLIT
ncbi:SbcB [Desulfamplus magnetovallimortis]|uniref:SbcB n=1 Tax=Desulfamplus magnetovallimortis TaxID=1246637 RepID=A0A1W1HKG8_9BACT|nr:exonuclease domain-containing protein [Desulfamplus magnetovallimortis]SLM32953.1 SbcB [Desulfamplus magnetovallimortis]